MEKKKNFRSSYLIRDYSEYVRGHLFNTTVHILVLMAISKLFNYFKTTGDLYLDNND